MLLSDPNWPSNFSESPAFLSSAQAREKRNDPAHPKETAPFSLRALLLIPGKPLGKYLAGVWGRGTGLRKKEDESEKAKAVWFRSFITAGHYFKSSLPIFVSFVLELEK